MFAGGWMDWYACIYSRKWSIYCGGGWMDWNLQSTTYGLRKVRKSVFATSNPEAWRCAAVFHWEEEIKWESSTSYEDRLAMGLAGAGWFCWYFTKVTGPLISDLHTFILRLYSSKASFNMVFCCKIFTIFWSICDCFSWLWWTFAFMVWLHKTEMNSHRIGRHSLHYRFKSLFHFCIFILILLITSICTSVTDTVV